MPRKKFLPASFNVSALLASIGIALGILLVIAGLGAAVTGRDALRLPEQIERLSPADNEKVLRQSEIMIDFVAGYEAVLIIDGVEIPTTRIDELTENGKQPRPGEQLEIPPTAIYDPGNYTLGYLPQEGGPITELKQGTHQATVLFW
ncbi:MAG: hypothetical protein WCL35_09960, partial [bacterium]